MSLICAYFSAPSDEVAGTALEGGPAAAPAPGFDIVELGNLEPVVVLGKLEALLSGVDYDVVSANPRQGHAVATGEEIRMVVTLTDELRFALARASQDRVREVAVEWARIEEFRGDVDASGLVHVSSELGGLARRAEARGEHLYCWVC